MGWKNNHRIPCEAQEMNIFKHTSRRRPKHLQLDLQPWCISPKTSQTSSSTNCVGRRRTVLGPSELLHCQVSTAWANPSQCHLFFTLCLYSSSDVRKWCSRIRPGPHGISRHVRVLQLLAQLVGSGTLQTALPHFASFQNLQELEIIGDTMHRDRIDILVPLLSSSAGTLKRLQ